MAIIKSTLLPKDEYHQFVASLYSDHKTMVVGTASAIVASLITWLKTGDANILVFSALFFLLGAARYVFMASFARNRQTLDVSISAKRWEVLAVAGGIGMGLCLGGWAFYVVTFCNDGFSELVAISACLTHMVGVAARNFGADILVTTQSLSIGLPIVASLIIRGDMWHIALGTLFVPFFTSARYLAAQVRSLFLEVIRSNARIQYMAKHDTLTGLLNRASFHRLVETRHQAGSGACMIAIFDIDDFKVINDSLGHVAGDHLLIEVAERIKKRFGDTYVIARFGGDEFVIFQPGPVGQDDFEAMSRAIFSCFETEFRCLDNVVRSSCSIGIATSADQRLDIERLLMKADLALYEAKHAGKRKYRVFEAQMDARFQRRERLKRDIATAAERGELSLLFQPIFDVAGNRISCCEALVRWHHHEFGNVQPTEFIPLAEGTGHIFKLTSFVLWEALRQASTWPRDVGVSVNLSALDLQNEAIMDEVERALAHFEFDPRRLTLEITESAILSDPLKATAMLFVLRKKGVKVALDDFGTGYANFSYLVDIRFDKLKIDRSLTLRVIEEERSRTLVAGVAEMAKKLDMLVTVEGIEKYDQLEVLLDCGNIDEAQGWMFGYPLPARAIAALLASGHASLELQKQAAMA